jgi:hypothetical protein
MLLAVQVAARAGPLLVAPIVNPRSVLAWCQSEVGKCGRPCEDGVGCSPIAGHRAEQVTFADLSPPPQVAPHQQSEACW